MKSIYISYLATMASSFCLAGLPEGFTEPGLVPRLKAGTIVVETPVSTPTELIQVTKAFYRNVLSEDFLALATNHKKYALLFKSGSPRIVKAETIETNTQKTEYSYRLLVEVDGPFGVVYEVTPEGTQIVSLAATSGEESKIANALTNYTELLSRASQVTRIIPFENGLLVEDRVHIILKQQTQSSAAMKKQLGILFARFPEAFRTELGGAPESSLANVK